MNEPFMRFVARTYEDATTKPHIDGLTFKQDITSEDDIENLLDELREFIEERFTTWQELQEAHEGDWVAS